MQEMRVQSRVGKITWRRKWQPTPVFSPGKFHEHRKLVGYSLGGHKELDTLKGHIHDVELGQMKEKGPLSIPSSLTPPFGEGNGNPL